MSASASALYVAEPPPPFTARPPMVVDCSALGAILFDEPTRDEALARLIGRSLHAPNLLDHEIVSAALGKRREEGPAEAIAQSLRDYATFDIDLHPVDPIAQYELAARYALTAYDAAYLWLAAELKAPLATFNRRLAEAAQAHLGSLS
ncbi:MULTISPECIES: type II toxin-antitoxin system VapC family toxin [unclassified Variovorax]|uniref:type II toxin-antitoxin system VapC family toxin n=1 Tax=unclassified Variovorax TaxID=663243 RepID=UPI00076D7789|nr:MULTISPECIES: type II toxin-antitoxin system VapC family toxin [unclassified Variovorax]KWT94342.1 hypothetical protein APY03_2631 [Variovorax sp. WDL1]PNG59066.1 Ribonuclease VapC9 [Variovorax sp. B4]PNG61143.1 Ribonuclease VapC9 [Variovorax sp. B2]VTV12894.1 putative nucleic acid-binding protein, contains PIN domain [Variovorax sp. WDL1]